MQSAMYRGEEEKKKRRLPVIWSKMKIQFQIFPRVFVEIIPCDVVSPKTRKSESERERERSQLTNKNIDIIVVLEHVPLNEDDVEEMLVYFILIRCVFRDRILDDKQKK